MKLDILTKDGKSTGKQVTLDAAVFGIEPNDHAIYLHVKQFLAHQRQGTHSTLERSTVSGSTKKLHKQKGTGGSRKGSVKSILFPGGPRAFGPHPHEYGFKLNQKVKDLAKRSALTHKALANSITVVEDFDMAAPKTKSYIDFLKNLKLENSKTLLVTGQPAKNLVLSSRNIQRNSVTSTYSLNTYDVLNADKLIISESGINQLNESLKA
jgi:large subunit ribosomal protein L4